jgi:hypothetical protein
MDDEGAEPSESAPEEVLSVFHRVTTDFPGTGRQLGFLVLAKSSPNFVFYFQVNPDQKTRVVNRIPTATEKRSISISTSNIQRIMINYQPTDAYLLIITVPPSNMYQFSFSPEASFQLLQLAQVLALHASPPMSLEDSGNFIGDSYMENEQNYHLFDISVENSLIKMPPELGAQPVMVDFVEPDLFIMSQFHIHAEDFTKNPVTIDELASFETVGHLRDAVLIRGVAPASRSVIWPLVFRILPFEPSQRPDVLAARTAEYLRCRAQWTTLSKTQLRYLAAVRDAFATIRVDVKRTHPPDVITRIKNWDAILIRILRTFTMWNLDVRYTQGLNDLAVVFMIVFTPAAGESLSHDEAEALAFWCFAAFVELIGSGLIAENMMVMQDREFTYIMTIVDRFHPACAKWLRSCGLGDLSFLISSFILAYGRSFPQDMVARIWEALVTVEAPWLFLRYFSASLLILSFPSFQKVQNCSVGKLVSIMDQIFPHQDVGAVIGISLSMMSNSPAAVQEEIKNRRTPATQAKERPPLEGRRKFFKPNVAFSTYYRESGELFA